MAFYFESIAEAKTWARAQARKDEETWIIAWHVGGTRVLVNGNYKTRYVAALSEPESRFEVTGKALAKTSFAKIPYERESNLRMELDEDTWKHIADMLDLRNQELSNLTNEEIMLLDELKKRGFLDE